MKKVFGAVGSIVLILIAYLALWPVPIQAVSWQAPVFQGYAGAYAVNTKLAGLTLISLGAEAGPEHVAIGKDGKLYVAVESGAILRMNADGTAQEVFAKTGGRVLGFAFDATGHVIAADCVKGLLSISPDGNVTLLADRVGESPIVFADALVIAGNGKVYFSDATSRFAPAKWGGALEAAIMDILEQSATGRILEYDPATKNIRIVAKGLSFANGIALSKDETTLIVAELGRYKIWKISVAAADLDIAQPSPQANVLLDNLPGSPDNLMRGLEGRIWVGFSGTRNRDLDEMAGKPFLRELTLRLPRALWPKPTPYGHVMAFTEDGKIVADLQDPSGVYPETTGVTETADRIYIQNLHLNVLGWRDTR